MLATVSIDLLRRGLLAEGSTVVFIGSTPLLVRGRTNFVKLQTIGRRAGN